MKKMLIWSMALTLVLAATSSFCVADEFKVTGTITKIGNDQVTVKDEKGKEWTLAIGVKDLKVGDPILLGGQIIKFVAARAELTPQEIEFLTKQCGIDQADVDIIPKLDNESRKRLLARIEKRDCKLLRAFKDTRAYYKLLKPKTKLPTPPATWDYDYLTDEEFLRYTDILNSAPL